jgi:hypothetical protein
MDGRIALRVASEKITASGGPHSQPSFVFRAWAGNILTLGPVRRRIESIVNSETDILVARRRWTRNHRGMGVLRLPICGQKGREMRAGDAWHSQPLRRMKAKPRSGRSCSRYIE